MIEGGDFDGLSSDGMLSANPAGGVHHLFELNRLSGTDIQHVITLVVFDAEHAIAVEGRVGGH